MVLVPSPAARTRAPRRRAGLLFIALVPALSGACHRGLNAEYTGPRIHLISIQRQANPWLNLDRIQDEKPEGIRFKVFLMPVNQHKGVLVPGTFHIELYTTSVDRNGDIVREWLDSYDYPTETFSRKIKPTTLGLYYMLQLTWKPHDILGQDVEFVVSYIDPAGRSTYGPPQRVYVPKRVF